MLGSKLKRVRVSKVVDVKDNYTVAHLSSSRRNPNYNEGDGSKKYIYSDWSFSRLVGNAHGRNIEEGDVLELEDWSISFESYKKDDEWIKPKNPQLVIFGFSVYSSGNNGGSTGMSAADMLDEEDLS